MRKEDDKMINIQSDSRKIKKGDIFIALRGISSDGHDYINKAIELGASKIICEEGNFSVDTLVVPDTREYLNNYLKLEYNKYLEKMNIIGITGTNGKTTTAYLIYDALNKLGHKAAYIGTIGFYLDKKVCDLPNTTVDICDMYNLLMEAYDSGCKTVILEVSSHALCMGRIETLLFDYAIFTNLTQDHLDYHKTMDNYAKAKQILFKQIKSGGKAIINIDDPYKDTFMLEQNNNITYGFNSSDYMVTDYTMDIKGTNFNLMHNDSLYKIKSNLIGKYNIYNMTAMISVLSELGFDKTSIENVILSLHAPVGRLDLVHYKDNTIVIDYAHTPDAITKVITSIKEVIDGKIYVVFGCTGDRDRLKRPIMTKIVDSLSDYFIITNDDPHTEDPSLIVKDMLEGFVSNKYEVCLDRGEAIKKGIDKLNSGDVLFILGKGHEEFMVIGKDKIPFNDKKTVLECIKEKEI